MKFTVTALGGGRPDTGRVVDSIVRYLQPPPEGQARDAASAGVGPERYYADRGEEPGRWLGRAAASSGLSGVLQRDDFASVLAGRDPHTGERLVTAQGSAGRRATLGSGTHTRLSADGEALYGIADAAAALGVSRRELDRMLDVGKKVPAARLRSAPGTATGHPAGHPAGRPGGSDNDPAPPVGHPVGHPVGPPAVHPASAKVVTP